jgi:hypothetical protein
MASRVSCLLKILMIGIRLGEDQLQDIEFQLDHHWYSVLKDLLYQSEYCHSRLRN